MANDGMSVEGCMVVRRATGLLLLSLTCGTGAFAQEAASALSTPAAATPAAAPAAAAVQATPQGGTIRGMVVAGAGGKPGSTPLPGVAITAKNSLTGKTYSTSTDIDGKFAMNIPRNGRYVVRIELAGFAPETQEVVLTGVEAQAAAQGITIAGKRTDFGMQLASRAAEAEAKSDPTAAASALLRGTQNLSLNSGAETTDVTAGGGNAGAALPSLAGMGDSAGAGNDSVAVNGQSGQMNPLANVSEDEIRQRIEERVADARASGQLGAGGDPTQAIMSVLGGMMGGGAGGGRGGAGGGRGGAGGGRGGGSGAFRNFNPAQPHGSVFYEVANSALNSAPWSPTLQPTAKPSSYSNRFGASIAGSPYIPGLTKPNTKQFVFVNLTGQKNLNAFLATGRVPTDLERVGDFSNSTLGTPTNSTAVTLYDPNSGKTINNDLRNSTVPISATAKNLLAYYPEPNIPINAQGYNYQTVANAGSNNVAINARYVRTIGGAAGSPFAAFGGGGGGGGRRGGGAANTPPSLKQNINIGYNYSHSAADQRNIFLPLGGANETDGNGLNVGYTVSYGRLSNNASVNWNRLNSATRNYFTDTTVDPSTSLGLGVPNNTGGFADRNFYNGLPTFSISGFQTLSNTTPSDTINQTIAFSDFVAWRHGKHNMRYGLDVRRVHLDSIGGNNPLGTYTFTGYATANPADQVAGTAGQTSGDGFADFLLGLPQSTAIQAGLYKTYLRENVYDWYLTDDWRLASNLTLNASLRYDYFGPYTEKNDRLENLTHDATFSPASITPIYPGQNGYNNSLVNPDHALYSPRLGFAYKLKNTGLTKDTVVRGGYGINYNTGQYAVFAKSLSHQPGPANAPFAATQTNTFPLYTNGGTVPAATGCTTTQSQFGNRPATTANLTLDTKAGSGGFGCSTLTAIKNNYAVDKNYRLGMVQLYNLNIQKTIPYQIVLNVGYNGSKGSNLDVVGSPNATPTGVATPGIQAFDYETSGAASHSNQLVISAQKRQQKGIALGATYTYSHTIDNASGVGGAVGSPVQNLFNLAAEEGNSSFDQRHNLSGNWVIELPFGPNRAYFNKGGVTSHLLDGFSVSGTFTFASGTYYTPSYSGNEQEAASGNTYQQRPDRVFTQSLKGAGSLKSFFNVAAFAAPTTNGIAHYGSASPGSIEGPGTVSVNSSLSRTVQLGDSRSFEARVTATNVFNTVQYNGINVTQNSYNFGEVTGAAAMRALQVQARYRF